MMSVTQRAALYFAVFVFGSVLSWEAFCHVLRVVNEITPVDVVTPSIIWGGAIRHACIRSAIATLVIAVVVETTRMILE